VPVLALAGDTMLGRGVGQVLAVAGTEQVVGPGLRAALDEADALVLNLECCVSDRGTPWPEPGKRFFFRAPPAAVDLLSELGATAVTLANNHALDFGPEALADTLDLLDLAGIAVVGAGHDEQEARRPASLPVGAQQVGLVGLTDHPAGFAAGPDRAGVAYADLADGLPAWVTDAVSRARSSGPVLVSPHWGPNLVAAPLPRVQRAAEQLLAAGAELVAGHSAHVPHGVRPPVLFDLGDFVDDYAVHPVRRNDLGVLWLVTLDGGRFTGVDLVPLRLGYARTDVATGPDRDWLFRRLRTACAELGTAASEAEDGRLHLPLT